MSKPANIASFSGGQTSGYMLRRLMDSEPDFDSRFRVVFENTGREHDATLDFVRDVEKHWGVHVTWLEYTRVPAVEVDPMLVPEGRKRANLLKAQEAGLGAHWFREVNYETAARRGQPGPFDELLKWLAALPNVRGRSCSAFLKRRTLQRYLEAQETGPYNCYIGIRADEAHRATEIIANLDDRNEIPQFPLIESGIRKADVDAWWNTHPFRLNIPNHMGNCDMCFLKAFWKRVKCAQDDPEAAQWWLEQEGKMREKGVTGDGALFRKGQSYAKVIAMAEGLPKGFAIPREKPKVRYETQFLSGLDTAPQTDEELLAEDEDVPCSCAVGGYRSNDDEDD
jgi:3'-phosphoadenosine 5'-phosphosulfate sulfotransferase (PAPS reductase)/FAD synthetase